MFERRFAAWRDRGGQGGESRRSRRRSSQRNAAFELLEGRALLAITGLPAAGDQLATDIVLAADSSDPTNTLQISLSAETGKGLVASIDIGDGSGVQQFWNFGGKITFTGTADTGGTVANNVSLTTPYEADVANGTKGPKDWQVACDMATSPITTPVPANLLLQLFNADSLVTKAGYLGSLAQSTIEGTFQSPTASPTPGQGSQISLWDYSQGISVANDLSACDLVLDAEAGTIDVNAGATTSLTISTIGDLSITDIGNPVTIDSVNLVSTNGDITVSTPGKLTFADTKDRCGVVAQNGTVHLEGVLGLTVPSDTPIVANRLKLVTAAATPMTLAETTIHYLQASTAGDLTVTDSRSLVISDLNPTSASVQIAARTLTLTAPGIRVVDGINASSIDLSTNGSSSATATVQFAVTAQTDNPASSATFAGTLRDMIEYVNANTASPQAMSIVFDELGSSLEVGGGVVTVTAALPAFVKPITLDGNLATAVAGSTMVGITGNNAVTTGLRLTSGSSGSTIRDTAVYGFTGAGVTVESASNLISGSYVGADRSKSAAGNLVGIDLVGSSAVWNTIGVGTVGTDSGNLIAANSLAGVRIRSGANYNRLYGNTIGASGQGNLDGVVVQASLGTVIGGTDVSQPNVIGFNTDNGIRLRAVNAPVLAFGTQVVGNTIDSNGVSGAAGSAGVLIEGGARTTLGGTAAGAGNTITGNSIGINMRSNGTTATRNNVVIGNDIKSSVTGGVLVDQGYANLVQSNTVAGSVLAPPEWGVRLLRTAVTRTQAANQVVGNTITANGTSALNGGIVVENSSGQIVGGIGTRGNVVNANSGSGIVVTSALGSAASSANVVEGNVVGTNVAGDNLGNAFDGIRVQGSLGNTVRGNTVRFNDTPSVSAGIAIHDAVAPSVGTGNMVLGNTVSDNDIGVRVIGGARTTIGGTLAALGNWVYRNASHGIAVDSSSATGASTGVLIQNNRIGIAPDKSVAGNGEYGINLVSTVNATVNNGNVVANNGTGGIAVQGGRGAVVGAVVARKGNVISSNAGDGVAVGGAAVRTDTVVVAGNAIDGNSGYGISVTGASTRGVIVGRSPSITVPDASGNAIVGNTTGGVLVDGASAVTIIANSYVNNGGSPIALVNGANSGISPPTLTLAKARVAGQKNPQYDVRGTVSGTAGQRVYVDIYGERPADGGQYYLGRVLVTIGSGGTGSFRTLLTGSGGGFETLSATSTPASTLSGGTSEFSASLATT